MGNPVVPAQASMPISPPLAKMPIGYVDPNKPSDSNRPLDVLPSLQFLKAYQELWAAIGGSGGIGGLIISNPWTPVLAGKGTAGSQTYLSQWGRYISAGSLVVALFNIKLVAFDPASIGSMEIAGLPIKANGDAAAMQAAFMGSWGGITLLPAYSTLGGRVVSGSQTVDLYQSGNGEYAAVNGSQPLTNTQFLDNAEIVGGVVYIT